MILKWVALGLVIYTAFSAGCANAPKSRPAPPAEKVLPEYPHVEAIKPGGEKINTGRPQSSPGVSRTSEEPLRAGEYALIVDSEPQGATVVVNGKPCGKTPCRVIMLATGRGFLREAMSIKVRFVAENETQASQTVEEALTALDKVPAEIRFTPAGVTRVVR